MRLSAYIVGFALAASVQVLAEVKTTSRTTKEEKSRETFVMHTFITPSSSFQDLARAKEFPTIRTQYRSTQT